MKNQRGVSDAGIAALVVIVVLAIVAGIWGLTVALSDPVGKGEAYKQVHGDATYRNSQVNHFHDACAGIQALEDKIAIAKQNLKADQEAGMDAGTLSRDRLNVSGVEGTRAEQIRQYNQDAVNSTKSFLREANLPSHINPNKEHTSCVR